MLVFVVLTLLHIPVMQIYNSYGNYRNTTEGKLAKAYSLGNMGFSGSKCVHSKLATDRVILSC